MNAWRERYSTLWQVAVAVAALGVLLAVIGLIAGGPDQAARDNLRTEVDQAQSELSTAETELSTTLEEGQAYAQGVQKILAEGDEFCGCGRRGRKFHEELEDSLEELIANPTSPSASAHYNGHAEQVNSEKERFDQSLNRLRSLNASLPEPPGS